MVLDASAVEAAATEGRIFLTDHAVLRLRQRWNRGAKASVTEMRAAVAQMVRNAEAVEVYKDEARVRRLCCDAVFCLERGQDRSPRLVLVTIFRRGGGAIPTAVFK